MTILRLNRKTSSNPFLLPPRVSPPDMSSSADNNKDLEVPEKYLQIRVKYLQAWRISHKRMSTNFLPAQWDDRVRYWSNHQEHRDARFRIINGPNRDANEADGAVPHGIPRFWLKAMKNHVEIGCMVRRKEFKPLEHLTDIRLEFGDGYDYTLIFSFEENPFFSNTELRKCFNFLSFDRITGLPKPWEATSDTIKWKPGMDVRKLPNRDTVQHNNWPPFFNWLSETVTEAHPFKIQQYFAIGEEFKDDLVVRAVDWYTGALKHKSR